MTPPQRQGQVRQAYPLPVVRIASETLSPVKTGSCQDPAALVLHTRSASNLNPTHHPGEDSPQHWALSEAGALVQHVHPVQRPEGRQQAGGEESGEGQPTGGPPTGLGGRAEWGSGSAPLLRGLHPETSPGAVGRRAAAWGGSTLMGAVDRRTLVGTAPAGVRVEPVSTG